MGVSIDTVSLAKMICIQRTHWNISQVLFLSNILEKKGIKNCRLRVTGSKSSFFTYPCTHFPVGRWHTPFLSFPYIIHLSPWQNANRMWYMQRCKIHLRMGIFHSYSLLCICKIFFLGQFWYLCYYVVLYSIPDTFSGRNFLAHLDDTHHHFLLKDFLPNGSLMLTQWLTQWLTSVKSTSYLAKCIFCLACLVRLLSKSCTQEQWGKIKFYLHFTIMQRILNINCLNNTDANITSSCHYSFDCHCSNCLVRTGPAEISTSTMSLENREKIWLSRLWLRCRRSQEHAEQQCYYSRNK